MLFLIILCLIVLVFIFIANFYFYFKEQKKKYNNKFYNLNFLDDKKINEVNIIGTHQSLTYKIKNLFSPFAKTQNYDLDFQLKKNVRYFDLRFKIENNKLEGYHNFVKLNINHEEIFKIFIDFLNNNPDQFIIIVLKNEEFKNHEAIIKFLDNYITENKLEEYFHYNHLDWDYIPLIKDIKKKIYILNFIKKNNGDFYRFPWKDNKTFTYGSITISDCYKISEYEKLKIYKEFESNMKKEHLNLFYFSSEYKYIFGLYFYNKFFKKKIEHSLDKEKIKQNHLIYIFDFIDIHQDLAAYIYE